MIKNCLLIIILPRAGEMGGALLIVNFYQVFLGQIFFCTLAIRLVISDPILLSVSRLPGTIPLVAQVHLSTRSTPLFYFVLDSMALENESLWTGSVQSQRVAVIQLICLLQQSYISQKKASKVDFKMDLTLCNVPNKRNRGSSTTLSFRKNNRFFLQVFSVASTYQKKATTLFWWWVCTGLCGHWHGRIDIFF